ncbi:MULTISPECIES: ATP-dependent DNA helicase [Catenuloplanes]|uniref:Exodeoxyribonuclease-5 n=1 Tax=Catenuloplanes niger TaxID=587534 RepID=A0AAE3ZRE9_9ACTN|nr:DEAD/DEAH box helicase [Catenuloplanes niger]MDR7323405.1 exodeoxyribonuclease-5 [Catenuloplanes niger]
MTIHLDLDDPFTGVTAPATSAMDWSPQQQEAIEKIVAWYRDPDGPQVFRLFGYAGTGKTTLARSIVEQLGVRALYAAFTGKAAYVLRSKGCEGASTVHSLIYTPQDKVRAHLEELERKLLVESNPMQRAVLETQIAVEREKLETPDFILREDSPLETAPLLVLDEVSMVGSRMAADLLSFGVRLLVLGDPAQLPPVDGGGYFIDAEPDHLLTEIHRSALDSPVTRLATSVRKSAPGDRSLGLFADGDSGRRQRVSREDLAGFDQVLVGTNKTRWQAIHLMRSLAGLCGPVPQPGDKIIGLANSTEADIFNGQQLRVASVLDQLPLHPEADRVRLLVEEDTGHRRPLTVWLSGFQSIEGEKKAKKEGRGSVAAATFAQAITCHKSQGSQYDHVLVVDESYVFSRAAAAEAERAGHPPDAAAAAGHINGQRWLYTAITRAAERVVVIPGPRGLPA